MNESIDDIDAFVPTEILSWLGPTLDEPVPTQRIEAVVLFCDISSFATIANRLVGEGRSGFRTLRSALNDTFDTWITAIHAHGGTVARFIGDAIIAVWRIETAAEYESAIRSGRGAAEAIQRSRSGGLSVAGVDVTGTCGLGVGALDIMSISVGHDQSDLVVVGDALRRATAACEAAQRGTVELSDGRSPSLPVAAAPGNVPAAMVARHVPHPIRDRLEAGHREWLGEIRLVSVMFIGVPAARDPTSVQRSVALVTENLGDHDNQMVKVNVDDKGLVMMVVYGAPTSFRDDPARAVGAALAVAAGLSGAGLNASIGLASGRAFCGVVGNETRHEYDIMGHVANLAHRLMGQQQGVLVDSATAFVAGPRFVLRSSSEHQLKGIEGPVQAGHPEATPVIHDTQTLLAGRETEKAAVHQLLAGETQVLLVEGDAGMGKSTISRYAAGLARDAGLRLLGDTASVIGEPQPYAVWRRAFASTWTAEEIRRTTFGLAEQDPWFAARLPLTAVITGDEPKETALTRQMSAAVRSENTRRALLKLFAALIADQKTMLILEDGQWFDSASWALLEVVIREKVIDRILVNFRPIDEPVPQELDRITAAPGTNRLLLGDLNPADLETLLMAIFDVDVIPPDIIGRMADRGAGNPLFAEQLAYALIDTGQIQIQGRAIQVVPSATEDPLLITDTLESILTSRIDQAPQAAQLTLKVASVIGREFDATTLVAVHPVADPTAVAGDTATLTTKRLLRPTGDLGSGSYQFWHRLTRDVAYQLLPEVERIALHERIARWLEQNDRTEGPGVLAHHYLAAGQWRTAAIYLDQAASAARQTHSNVEVVRHLRTLVDLANDELIPARRSDIARWLRHMGDALMEMGHLEESRASYKAALSLWGCRLPDGAGRQIAGIAAALPSLFIGTKVVDDPGRHEAAAESALILPHVSQMAYFNQNLPELLYTNVNAVRYGEQSGNPASLARAHGAWAIAASLSGMQRTALRSDRRALQEAARDGGLQTIAYANLLHGVLHVCRAHWDEAAEGFGLALAGYRSLGASADWETTNGALSFAWLCRGDVAILRERIDESSPAARNQITIWMSALRIYQWILTDQTVGDAQLDRLSRMLAEPSLERGDALLGFGVISMAAAQRGDQVALADALDHFTDWIAGLPASSLYAGFGLYAAVVGAMGAAADPAEPRTRRRGTRLARRTSRHLRVTGIQNPAIRALAQLGAAHAARTGLGRRRHLRRARRLEAKYGTGYVEPLLAYATSILERDTAEHPTEENAHDH